MSCVLPHGNVATGYNKFWIPKVLHYVSLIMNSKFLVPKGNLMCSSNMSYVLDLENVANGHMKFLKKYHVFCIKNV